jgi:hypothetical protein
VAYAEGTLYYILNEVRREAVAPSTVQVGAWTIFNLRRCENAYYMPWYIRGNITADLLAVSQIYG